MSVEQTRGRVDCGLDGVREDVSPVRFRGIRIFDISDILEDRNDPIQVAVAPSRIKTSENPTTNKSELIRTTRFSLFRKDGTDLFSFIPVKVTPDTKEI